MHYFRRGFWLLGLCLLFTGFVEAQVVQPLIAEYTGKGAGSFVVTNSSFASVAVVLEPESFSIDLDGRAIYKPLDDRIHLEMSTTSLRLGPRESQTVFYTVTADSLPAWLTVYATFSQLHPGPGVSVHIMLPHTIYLYSRKSLTREAIRIDDLEYHSEAHEVVCRVTNTGEAAGRAQEVGISAGHSHVTSAGFPLLPGSPRQITLHWTEAKAPDLLTINFEGFAVKVPIASSTAHEP